MTMLGRALTVRNTIDDPTNPVTGGGLLEFLGGGPSTGGKRVNEKSAMGMSAVYRAVTLKAGVAASLPLHAIKSDGYTRAPAASQAAMLLRNPHPDLTRYELWEIAYTHRYLWGNAYLRKLRNRLGQVVELWPIEPWRVKVGRATDTSPKVYEIDGGAEIHTDETILHLPGFGYDGICGVSPVRIARQSIGLALAAEEYGARLFENGSLASGILQTEQRLTKEQAETIQKRWKAKSTGLNSAHETVVLDSGAKFQQLTIPPEDAQFLESRRFQIGEVSRWYGVPPFLMFETEKSTSWGTGLEQQAIGWVVYDLRRDLTGVEQRLTKHALSAQDVDAKYSIEGLLRGDSTARAAFYKAMWEIGVFSTNEVRALEDRAPVEGGDVRYRPLNMGELGNFDTTSSDQTEEVPAHAGS